MKTKELIELEDIVRDEKKRVYSNNFYQFDKEVLGFELFTDKPHKELCDFIQKNEEDRFKLILMPRGSFKSSAVTVGYSIWRIVQNPNLRILIDSETYDKSKAFLSAIKQQMESNEKFRDIFGELNNQKSSDSWARTAITVPRTVSYKEPTVDVVGIGNTRVGMHYDIIICDDLHSEKNITSKEMIEGVIDHYKLLFSLLEPEGEMIVIGTRWDYSDLYSYIIENESDRFKTFLRKAIDDNGDLLMPNRLTKEFLDNIKKTQGTYHFSCNPWDAPILMSDWSTKNICDVEVGDEIIGFKNGTGKYKNQLVKTKVLKTDNRMAEVQEVYLESGRKIRCTADHNWYTGRQDKTHRLYAPTHLGGKLYEVVNTDIKDWKFISAGYLAGMIDGEGACKYGNISIHQSKEKNPEVYNRIKEELDFLKIKYHQYDDFFVINGSKQTKFDILRYGNPAKKEQIIKTLWDKPGMMIQNKDKVYRIVPGREERVFALTTETGNYIVWGYASKNCQYQNEPVSDDSAVFKKEDFQYYKEEDLDVPMNIFMSVDPAVSLEKTADYSAIVVGGFDNAGNIYILDLFRQRVETKSLINEVFSLAEKWRPRMIGFEDVAFQKVLLYNLNDEMRARGIFLPVKGLKRDLDSKEMRIRALQPKYQSHQVYHPRNHTYLFDLEFELLRFPRGKTDDIIDAEADLLQIAYPRKKRTRQHYKPLPPRSKITGV